MISIARYFINRVNYRALPPGVKQTIFSYLPLRDLVASINKLNSESRALIKDSAIVRFNKRFHLGVRSLFEA